MKRWFWPTEPDVVALLGAQGQATVEGLEAFSAWAAGEAERSKDVREAEHRADAARREVLVTVRKAFVTPTSPEDLVELSERLDGVLNRAKDLVRESEVLDVPPDAPLAEMAAAAADGARHLVEAIALVVRDPEGATKAADAAIKTTRRIERVYRRAMPALMTESSVRLVIGRQELYRRGADLGDAVEHVAHRVWYAVVKQA